MEMLSNTHTSDCAKISKINIGQYAMPEHTACSLPIGSLSTDFNSWPTPLRPLLLVSWVKDEKCAYKRI